MSSLSRQLENFRAVNVVTAQAAKTSFLFDKRDVMGIDKDQLAQLAYTGFCELAQADSHLERFSSLFDRKQSNRDFLSQTEAAELDSLIGDFLSAAGYAFLTPSFQGCLEWLIQSHSIQATQAEAMILACLPYHDTPDFNKLVSVFNGTSSLGNWSFLDSKGLKRSTLVKHCQKSSALVQSIITFAKNIMTTRLPKATKSAEEQQAAPSVNEVDTPMNTSTELDHPIASNNGESLTIWSSFMAALLLEILSTPLSYDITPSLLPFVSQSICENTSSYMKKRIPGSDEVFGMGVTILAELMITMKSCPSLTLLKQMAVKNCTVEYLAEILSLIISIENITDDQKEFNGSGKIIRRLLGRANWNLEIIESCKIVSDHIVTSKVISFIKMMQRKDDSSSLSNLINTLQTILSEQSSIAPILQESESTRLHDQGDVHSSSSESEEEINSLPKKVIKIVETENQKLQKQLSQFEKKISQFFESKDGNFSAVFELLRDLYFEDHTIARELSYSSSDNKDSHKSANKSANKLEQSAEFNKDTEKLITVIIATLGEPGNLFTRIIELKNACNKVEISRFKKSVSEKSKSWRKIVNKVTDDYLFGSLLLSTNEKDLRKIPSDSHTSVRSKIWDFVSLASNQSAAVKTELTKMIKLFAPAIVDALAKDTADQFDESESVHSNMNDTNWELISACFSVGLIGEKSASLLIPELCKEFSNIEAVNLLTSVVSLGKQSVILPLFNQIIENAVTQLEQLVQDEDDDKIMLPSKLISLLDVMSERFGEFFADLEILKRIVKLVFSCETDTQQMRLSCVKILRKAPVEFSLESLRVHIMGDEYQTQSLILLADYLAVCDSNGLPLDILSKLLIQAVLSKVAVLPSVQSNIRSNWDSDEIIDFKSAENFSDSVVEVFFELSNRLTLNGLETFFKKLVSVIQTSTKDNPSYSEAVRGVLLESFIRVSAQAEAAAVAILPLVAPEVIIAMKSTSTDSAKKSKKRRAAGVATVPIRSLGLRAAESVMRVPDLPEETIAELVEVAASLVTVEREDIVTPFIVNLAGKCDDAKRKILVGEILRNARSISSNERGIAARMTMQLWKELGPAMNMAVSECLIYAVELEDDADDDVSAAARALIKEIENVTGESIQDKIR